MKAGSWFRRLLGVGALALVSVLATQAIAQEGGGRGGRGGPGGGPGGGRGGFNPEDFRRRVEERMKEMLGVQDEEWQVIQPLLQTVQDKQRTMRAGGFGFFGGRGRGGPGGENADEPADIVALREALENPNTPAADIKTKLDAYRAGQKQREEELAAAREELRKVLTVRQEAQLVLMGMLD